MMISFLIPFEATFIFNVDVSETNNTSTKLLQDNLTIRVESEAKLSDCIDTIQALLWLKFYLKPNSLYHILVINGYIGRSNCITTAADALSPCVARSSGAIILIIHK